MEIYSIKKNYKDNDMKRIIEWDLLRPEDVEVRVATTKNGKTTLLLYQDSRCAMRALDKQFGSFGWQMDYKVVGDQIYGTLSIYDEEKQMWISKSDTGDKSNISEDKGQSSDILKRCAVRWGFARELYTTPKIVVDDGYGNSGYKVSEIDYNEYREITHLVIVNRFNKEVFRWDKGDVTPTYKTAPKQIINDHIGHNELEWTPEDNRQPVAVVQMTKQLTPVEELTQWYQTTTHTEVIDKFYNYWYNRLSTNGWQGKFNLNTLIQKYCK